MTDVSSVSSSDSEFYDPTLQSELRNFDRRPGGVSFRLQGEIRLERSLRRIYEDYIPSQRSLNLGALFGDTEEDSDDEGYAGIPQGEGEFQRWAFGLRQSVLEAQRDIVRTERIYEDFLPDRAADAAGAAGGAEEDELVDTTEGESDWDQLSHPGLPDTDTLTRRSVVGNCLHLARADVARCLLGYVLNIRRGLPTIEPEVAWNQLVERLQRDEVVTQAQEAEVLWEAAFRSSREEHFRHIVEANRQEVVELWNTL